MPCRWVRSLNLAARSARTLELHHRRRRSPAQSRRGVRTDLRRSPACALSPRDVSRRPHGPAKHANANHDSGDLKMKKRPPALSTALLVAVIAAATAPALAADPVKIGLLEDQSGNFAIAVIPKIQATQLAIEEINAKGGILGRQI